MDTTKKYHIDQWVEDSVYSLLEEVMKKRQITATDAATLTLLIQMYQAIQIENVSHELDLLWKLLADGDAGIYISTILKELDVNVKQKSQEVTQQTKRGHHPT